MQKYCLHDSRLNVDGLLCKGRGRGFGVISGAYHIDTDLQVALYTRGREGGRERRDDKSYSSSENIRVHLGTTGGVIGVSQQQPLVNETLLGFIVHHAQVKLRNTGHTAQCLCMPGPNVRGTREINVI